MMDGCKASEGKYELAKTGDNIICSNKYHCGDILYNSQDIVTALAPLSLRQCFFYFPAAHTKQNIQQNRYLSPDPVLSALSMEKSILNWTFSSPSAKLNDITATGQHKSLSQKVSIQSWQKQNNWLKQNPTFSLQYFKQNHIYLLFSAKLLDSGLIFYTEIIGVVLSDCN